MESKQSETRLLSERLKTVQAANAALNNLPSIDVSSDILDQITSNKWYRYEDIVPIGKLLCRKYGFNEEEQFDVIGSITLNDTFVTPENEKPKFIIYNKGLNHWVVFCVMRTDNRIKILYKDSFCEPIPKIIEETLQQKFSDEVDFISHGRCENPDQEDGYSCGPMALKNLEIMMENMKEGIKDFSSKFCKIKFCRQKDISTIKTDFKLSLVNPLIKKELQDLYPDDDFKGKLKQLFKLTLGYTRLGYLTDEYSKVMKEELEKQENDPSYKIDQLRLEEAEKKIIEDFVEENQEDIEQFLKLSLQKHEANKIPQNENEEKDISENSVNENRTRECKFEADLSKFTNIFKLLKGMVETDELKQILQNLCERFELNYDDVIKFISSQDLDESKCTNEEFDIYRPSDINELSKKLPKINTNKNQEKSNVKPFEQILAEISFGMDDLSPSNNECLMPDWKTNAKNGNKEKLKEDFEKYKSFEEKYKDKTEKNIREWANNHKRKLTSNDAPEAIAIMFRANYLATGGQKLRIPQIVSLLTFLNTGLEKGKICQINTGEGKTVILSLLAAMKVLQGMQVDVITSNQILAAEGVKDRQLFYDILGITCEKNNIDENEPQNLARKCYGADVVYGTIANFQFDYLRDSFEKIGTRSGRKFGCAILDEVDNMTIDNGSYIAKLAAPFPGMDLLRYIYIKIWQELCKAEKELQDDFKEEYEKELEKIKNDTNEFEGKCFDNIFDLFQKLKQQIKSKIKLCEPARIELIPSHLKQYSEDMIDTWIDNAVNAKYHCEENEQYLIKKKGGEEVIIPIDYQNTGATLTNSVWSNGLHQFVQLKHNLCLTTESLTCCFISNIGYLKLYKNNIFGMTGTLGSIAEQELLSEMYNLDYAKIPTYKQKHFEEEEGIVIKDDKWNNFITLFSVELADKKRSVLIICKTIKDLRELERNIKALRKLNNFTSLKIKTYANEDYSNIVEDEIGSSEIIIATNIAGRGTDFKTSLELEENGGLHVCVTFLPCNQRVEDQAFGRTSRQGNHGTAQIIVKESEVSELGIEVIPQMKFSIIKEARDILEKGRLEEIKTKKLIEISFQDELFMKFSNLYNELKESVIKKPGGLYIAEDLKECWAHWLHKNKINAADVSQKLADTEFDNFKVVAEKIIEDGQIDFNPFYSIQQAGYFLSNGILKEAELALNHAIVLSKEGSDLLSSAYFKLFEVAMENGGVIKERIKGMLPDRLKNWFYSNDGKDSEYKIKAKEALEKTKKALSIELNYIKECFFDVNESVNETIQIRKSFQDILSKSKEDNFLLKHLESRFLVLSTFYNHVESLLANIKECSENDDIYIKSRKVHFLRDDMLSEVTNEGKIENQQMNDKKEPEKIVKSAIKKDEILEFESAGLDTMYALKKVEDMPRNFKYAASAQLSAGIAVFCIGALFPPALLALSPIGSTLIAEGFTDLAIAAINPDGLVFLTSNYIIKKCVSLGVSLLAAGVSAIASATRVFDKVIYCLRGLASLMRQCPYLKSVFEILACMVELFASGISNFQVIINKIHSICSYGRAGVSCAISTTKSFVSMRNFVVNESKFQHSNQHTKFKDFSDVCKEYDKVCPAIASGNFLNSSKNDKNLQPEETNEKELFQKYPNVNKVKDLLIESLNKSGINGKCSINCDINHSGESEDVKVESQSQKYDSCSKKAHKDIIEIVSNAFEQFIVVNVYCDLNTIKVYEFGKEYWNNGRSPIILNFSSCSELLEGSFDISNKILQIYNEGLIFKGDINSLYSGLEQQFKKQGFSLTASLLKDIVEGNDSTVS